MKEPRHMATVVFYGLTIVILLSSVISVVKVISWMNKPFPGFLLYPTPYVASFSSRDWPGKEAGIRYTDRILEVDGNPVNYGHEIFSAVRSKGAGTVVEYTVLSEGETREVAVPVRDFNLKDLIYVFLPTFLIGLIIYTLGIIVYILKSHTMTGWVFLVMCFSLGIYGITGFEIQSTFMLVRLHMLAMCLFPATFIHLGLIFPERKRLILRFPSISYWVYVPAVILGSGFQVYFFTYPEIVRPHLLPWIPSFLTLSSFARLFTLTGFLGLIILVLVSFFMAPSSQAKTRARMMIFGVAVAFLPVGILMILALSGKVFFPFNFIPIFVIFFPLFIAYSIVRHNMFDADAIIRRTVGYVVVTTIVIGIYAVVSLILNMFMGKYQLAQSPAFPVVFTLGVILVFNPLRDRIQSIVDRLFYRLEYDYQETVQKISETMRSLLKLDAIGKSIIDTALDTLFVDGGCLLLMNQKTKDYECISISGECFLPEESSANEMAIASDKAMRTLSGSKELSPENVTMELPCESPLIEKISERKKEITVYDVQEDPFFEGEREACEQVFTQLNALLIIPLIYEDRLIGLISLGAKKSGKFYRREDINLLNTLANQGAVAIENAIMIEEVIEKERMEEELSIAKDLQVSMLPADCPQIEGLEIAAFSESAKEVGGDFYDFIDMGTQKAGFVIGDVTGKSVSGALVMSASRSIFRMLSEEGYSVGEIMVRANRRTKKDIKTGMFVALLYAVMDAQKRAINMCSAGQTQPILFSAENDTATLLETKGDTFPLGIIEDVDYQETHVQLQPGDRVVFYTDGIVEAMNEKEEMFGFERLQEIVQGARSMTAEELLKTIIDDVNNFAGGAAQHDDITVIVVSVEAS